MAATSLVVIIDSFEFDASEERYKAHWRSDTDDPEASGMREGYVFFDGNELLATINLRVITAAQEEHNNNEDAGIGLLTPKKLFGGLVGL